MNQIPRSTLVPAALLVGLCPLVANSIYEDDTGSGAQILATAAAGQPVAAMISNVLFLVSFVAVIVVLGVLAAAIARSSPALSGIVAVAGAASVAIKLSEAQTGMALRETAGVLNPGTAEALVAIDEAGFTVYGFLLALSLGAAGLGILRSGAMAAWLGWWAPVMGGLGMATAAIGIVVPGAYVPLPFVLLLVWLSPRAGPPVQDLLGHPRGSSAPGTTPAAARCRRPSGQDRSRDDPVEKARVGATGTPSSFRSAAPV